jgi:hypothetical protein
MPLSPAEAQDALRDISRAEHSSATLYRYRHAAPHLILWGVIWAVGYGASYARPQWGVFWPVLALIGTIASFWIGWKSKPQKAAGYDWRFAATWLAIFLFIAAVFAVMPPRNVAELSAFFPLLVALFYGLIGIWIRGTRLIIAGAAVAALTIIGFFLLPQIFLLWLAVVGGGALILGGFWLRSV